MSARERIGFGGGCHWCTEAVFQAAPGVAAVDQGFIASAPPDDAFSEAVLVDYHPGTVTLVRLIDIHLRTHSSASDHALRGKYRSAVYVLNAEQAERARAALEGARAALRAPLVTRVLPLVAFKSSQPRFHNYYRTDPDRAFCRTYIEPKLEIVRRMNG